MTSNGTYDGLFQLTGVFGFLSADFYVVSGQAQLISAFSNGAIYANVVTTATGVWQHLTLNSNSGTSEIALYSFGAGDFYVDNVFTDAFHHGEPGSSVTTFSAGVPEPASWVLMILGFGGLGAMLRRHRGMLTA